MILSKRSGYAVNPILEEDVVAAELERRGKKVIKLNRGDPAVYFPTPKYIIDSYVKALKEGKTQYSDATGNKEIKAAIMQRYKSLYGLHIKEQDIVVTIGVSEALSFINDTLINPGDRAILFKPYYAQYLPKLQLSGGTPIFESYYEKDNWNIELSHLNKSIKELKESGKIKKVKYLLITNPNNPTGTVLRKEILEEIVDIANENNILLISDEIYDEIVYNNAKFTSISNLAKGVPHIILNGASKNYDSTGFRLGMAIIPEDDDLSTKLKQKFTDFARIRLSVNTPSQYAFAEAMRNTQEHKKAITYMVKEIEKRVNHSMKILKENEYIDVVEPNGAYYIFPRLHIKDLKIKNDKEFVSRALKEEYIQLTRGSGFGDPDHFRIVSLPPKEILDYSLNKINEFCRKNAKR